MSTAALPRILTAQPDRELTTLPPKGGWLYRALRHPWAMPYNRLAVAVTLVNLLLFTRGAPAADMALLNFAVAILIRSQYTINGLFALATSVPTSWPLWFRWACGKVYHFGGIHVGAFFSGTLWFGYHVAHLPPSPVRTLGFVHMLVLAAMIYTALPVFRAKRHNVFEIVARFGGWASLVMFWAQAIMVGPKVGHVLTLEVLTFAVALPWLRLRKVPVHLARPSSHVSLASFNYGVTPFAGSSTDLSRNPLLEWHSFANVPWPDREGFRLTISRAGDWTGRLNDEAPDMIWVKGIPAAGVGNIETIFKKVVWVATGSGIGPCLPHLLANKVPSRLVWSTKNPERTYGADLVDEIRAVQPNAVIWNTDQDGKPDLVKLAYEAYRESGAEAIICIANKKTTWHVVNEFESRGIPAFGAIWDS